MRKIASLLSVLMLFSALAIAQTRTVSGVVRDDKGDPVPFATVTETGTKNATQADASGAFTIKIGHNSKLTITASGHASVTVTPTGSIENVTLKTTNSEMSEVVVTSAFGIKRSQRITPYSSQVVSDQELHIIPQTNLNSALAGKIA